MPVATRPSVVTDCRRRPLRLVRMVVAMGPLLGCAASGDAGGYADNATPGSSDPVLGPTPSVGANGAQGTDGHGVDTSMFPSSGMSTAAPQGETVFYVHDNRSLYRVRGEDSSMALAKVGEFDCIEDGGSPEKGTDTAMTDIAVDRDGRIFGISSRMVFQDIQVGPNGVQCKGRGKVLPGDDALRFYGATFAPRGTISETSETLVVGDTEGNLYSVDGGSGDVRVLGNMGTVPSADGNGHSYAKAHRGKRWELSGDLVFLDNGGQPVGFATVRDCPNPPSQRGCNTTDTLVELNMAALRGGSGQSLTKALRGQIVKAPGCADTYAEGYGSMFGIAAYKGDIIGFSRDAYVVRIDNNRGGACRVADMKGMVPFGFSGAGVTTLAPVTVPPPR